MRQDHPIRQTLCRRAAHRNIPVNGAFELTPRCSLNCKMCYIRMTPEQMRPIGEERSVSQWIELAREAREMGMTFLLLTGGEPFLRPDLFELLSAFNSMGIITDINSNGTLINEAVVAKLLQAPPSKINITLYGASRQTYEDLCGDGSAFDRVVHAIDLLRNSGILVCLNGTLTPDNYHELDELVRFAKDRGLPLRSTSYVIPPSRRGGLESAYRMPPENAGCVAFRSQLLFNGEEAMRKKAMSQLVMEDCYHETEEGISCLAGRSQFWVTWNGKMLPCGMLPQISSDPFEVGFREAWSKINEEVVHLPNCSECVNCPNKRLCPSCAASRYCETGSVTEHGDYLCKFTEAYIHNLQALATD